MTTKAALEAARVLENRRVAFSKRVRNLLENRRVAFSKRVRNLLGHLVGQRTAQSLLDARFHCLSPQDQVEYGPKADALAAELARVEPVGRALHPQKAEAVRAAREDAERVVERVRAALEAAGWDIHAVAPYPSSSDGQYKVKVAKYSLYSSLTTKRDPQDYSRASDRFVRMSDEGVSRFISRSEQDAALQYDMFICKMVGKVGDVREARIEGDHVWSHSILTVTLPDGTEQRWKTQQIVNYSVYGTPYLQWPSRVVK